MGSNFWGGPSDLCHLFRYLASRVYRDIGRGRAVGLVPWETTFTDNLLLDLATTRPREIFIKRFGADEESANGADWHWWFYDRDGYVGFRVQAKRAHPDTGHINLKQRAPRERHLLQAQVLAQQARSDGLVGLYCLYTDHQPGPDGRAACGPCPHGPLDPTQWGCALLLAETAVRHARAKRTSSDAVLRDSWPWYHLVCQHYGNHGRPPGITQRVRMFLATLIQQEPSLFERSDESMRRLFSDAPDDIASAFEERAPALIAQRPGIAGAILVDARNERRELDF